MPAPGEPGGAGVCAPRGFRAGVAAAGIRGDGDTERLDIAVIRSDRPCTGAGVFTRNTVKAAPVTISQLTLRRGNNLQAIVVNAGNANACTGAQGFRDALVMCGVTADVLDLDPSQVLVCSTGVIGRLLPMERVTGGIRMAARGLTPAGGAAAARAIMTTDTRSKTAAVSFTLAAPEVARRPGAEAGPEGGGDSERGARVCSVGGMAKGAGMIHPDMATLLVFLTTDVAAPPALLQPMLGRVVDATFNCLTVDGDSSTNDSVLLLANGAAGGDPVEPDTPEAVALEGALLATCESLAEQVVADAEGATKSFLVTVTGAVDDEQARIAARVVAGSPLVKTAVHGSDPNWGRIVAALGRSGATFTLDRCTVSIGGLPVFAAGSPAAVDDSAIRGHFASRQVDIGVDLGAGAGSGRAWGCDLTAEYVHINADYTT